MYFVRGTFLALTLVLISATGAFAQELTVTPVVIDEKAKPRDILKQSITILNSSERKLNLYPSVNDINVQEGEQAFAAALNSNDRSISLANWIELSRGVVELSPGEEKTIPFVIRVHLNAPPDDYHAAITFNEGSTRETAEARPPLATVAVNVDVAADVKETLQLNKFFTDRFFLAGDDVLFNFQLENIGNQDLTPRGEVRIYDRTGKEVAAVDVNSDKQTISPDQVSQLASVWSAVSGFGRYKAFLNVDYGASQKASVQDTIYFWIIPWQQLLGLSVASLIAIVFLALFFHRKLESRHHARLAHALQAHGVTPSVVAEPARAEKRSFFSRKKASAPIIESAPEQPKPKKPRFHEVVREEVHAKPHVPKSHHSIDLKSVHAHRPKKHTETHVINLKNRS